MIRRRLRGSAWGSAAVNLIAPAFRSAISSHDRSGRALLSARTASIDLEPSDLHDAAIEAVACRLHSWHPKRRFAPGDGSGYGTLGWVRP